MHLRIKKKDGEKHDQKIISTVEGASPKLPQSLPVAVSCAEIVSVKDELLYSLQRVIREHKIMAYIVTEYNIKHIVYLVIISIQFSTCSHFNYCHPYGVVQHF